MNTLTIQLEQLIYKCKRHTRAVAVRVAESLVSLFVIKPSEIYPQLKRGKK